MSLLELIKRPGLDNVHGRLHRERVHVDNTPKFSTSDFDVGCEVLVPRTNKDGSTFVTWCKVIDVQHASGTLKVDVPKEPPTDLSLLLLARCATWQQYGPAGKLLCEVRALRAENAMLKRKLEEQRASHAAAIAAGAFVPWVQPVVRSSGGCSGGGGSRSSSSSTTSGSPQDLSTALVVYTPQNAEEAEAEAETESCYVCGKCARTFRTPGGRTRHENRCTYIPTYTCERCGRGGFRSLACHRRFCKGWVQEEEEHEEHGEEGQEGEEAEEGDDADKEEEEEEEAEEEEEEEMVEVVSEWTRLDLRCQVSFQRLDDPARLAGCRHPSSCNFSSLRDSGPLCPVLGCNAKNSFKLTKRDEALAKKLRKLPKSTETVWLKGDELRLQDPAGCLGGNSSGRKRKRRVVLTL